MIKAVLDASVPKKPGFLPNLWVSAKDFRKKTRFLSPRASRTIRFNCR